MEKSYDTRTTRIDKSDKVSCIVQQLVDSGDSYLRYRKHVENIATVLPKIREKDIREDTLKLTFQRILL